MPWFTVLVIKKVIKKYISFLFDEDTLVFFHKNMKSILEIVIFVKFKFITSVNDMSKRYCFEQPKSESAVTNRKIQASFIPQFRVNIRDSMPPFKQKNQEFVNQT